jgi:hypothetical protein
MAYDYTQSAQRRHAYLTFKNWEVTMSTIWLNITYVAFYIYGVFMILSVNSDY